MKITGIIAEYNPFHNGHKYQIDTIRKAGTDYIIAVMSGDFVQRGEPAILNKYTRAQMALENGIDLVIELPVAYATASANHFAQGGVSLLHSLKVVDELAFGVEDGYAACIPLLSDFLACPPEAFNAKLDGLLREGITFPKARQHALSLFFNDTELKCLELSNSILALEYCKAIKKLSSPIKPLPITRLGSDYNDNMLCEDRFASASAVRKALFDGNIGKLSSFVPENVYKILESSAYLCIDDFNKQLHYTLTLKKELAVYEEVGESLANRIKSHIYEFETISSFADLLKTKNITHSGIMRSLLHILLELDNNIPPLAPYARVLGFRKQSAELLSLIKNNSIIPLISKLADADANPLLDEDIRSADIYNAVYYDAHKIHIKNDYSHEIVIV